MASPTATLPCPPFIDIPGLRNFRDAGGYPLQDAPTKIVRKGLLFRASEPSKVTEHGISIMTDTLGIKHVYDLRSQTEIENDAKSSANGGGRQVKEWAGSERVFAPVFSYEDYSPEAIAKRFSAFASEGSEVSNGLLVCCVLISMMQKGGGGLGDGVRR